MKQKLRIMFAKISCHAYILSRRFFRRKTGFSTNHILIVVTGALGDAALDAQALSALINYYKGLGKTIHLTGEPAVCQVLRMFPGMSDMDCHPSKFIKGVCTEDGYYRDFRKLLHTLRRYDYDSVILKMNRDCIWARCVAAGLKGRITAALLDTTVKKCTRKVSRFLLKYTVDELITFSDDLTQLERNREFAMRLGAPEYSIQIASLTIPSVTRRTVCKGFPYVTISVDSSSPIKCWPVENFIELIRRLLEQYEYGVVLTGNNVAEDNLKRYDAVFGANNRIKNMIGKTGLCNWIELIKGAVFHIGVDSGSIHVAASVGTRAFCLVGMWDSHRFFPYRIEEDTPGTAVPVCIYRSDVDSDSLPCKNCNEYGGYGYGNKRCREECRHGKPNLCLQNISADGVMEMIKENHED